MKLSVLSSGSKGNTTYIETNKTKILIDAGNSSRYITNRLKELDTSPEEIDAILITHIHSDHTNGLKILSQKIKGKVYITKKMYPQLDYLTNYEIIENDELTINDLKIEIIHTSHDTEDSLGYIINNNNKSIVHITDTGYINKKYFDILKNRTVYVFESNHDIEMLNNGRYPFHLRKRILSDKGHLSNYDSAKYLSIFIGEDTKRIILAHLSEENNTEELALNTLKNRLNKEKIIFDNIIIAKQNEKTELMTI